MSRRRHQWQRRLVGGVWESIDGATTKVWEANAARIDDSGEYRILVKSGGDSYESSPAVLRVIDPPRMRAVNARSFDATLTTEQGIDYRIEMSTDFVSWVTVREFRGTAGVIELRGLFDPAALKRSFRAVAVSP